MSAAQLNAFLRTAAADVLLQDQLRHSDAIGAAAIAAEAGFDVTVGDLTRYKARATTWQLSDDELAVVAAWQPDHQAYWWQCIWDC
jgi:predicted ribosomally synthesized peptide with nif11-like leader